MPLSGSAIVLPCSGRYEPPLHTREVHPRASAIRMIPGDALSTPHRGETWGSNHVKHYSRIKRSRSGQNRCHGTAQHRDRRIGGRGVSRPSLAGRSSGTPSASLYASASTAPCGLERGWLRNALQTHSGDRSGPEWARQLRAGGDIYGKPDSAGRLGLLARRCAGGSNAGRSHSRTAASAVVT